MPFSDTLEEKMALEREEFNLDNKYILLSYENCFYLSAMME